MNAFLLRRLAAFSTALPTTALPLILAAVLLAGCGGSEEFATNNTANSATQTATNPTTPANSAATPGDPGATAEPPSQPGKYGGSLTDVVIADPKTFNLWVSMENSSSGVVGPLYDALLSRNGYTQQWEGNLADLPVISKDGLTWTFKLKPDLKWSDGEPLNADDVIFTLNMIYDPKTQGLIREGMLVDVLNPNTKKYDREPLKYRKVDQSTVEFKFPVPYAPARDMLSFPIAPRHKLEAPYKAGRFNQTWGVNTAPKELVASSMWVMQSYVPGQRVVYTRNPHYWRKDKQGHPLPYLDNFVQLIVPNLNAMTLKFRGKETDSLGPIQPTDYPQLKRDQQKGDYIIHNLGPDFTFVYLGFNMNPNAKADPDKIKLFQQQKFRQAVAHAINREGMLKNLYRGLGELQNGPISRANKIYYNPNLPAYDFDLDKAKTLLREAGLKDSDGNGFMEWNGKEVRFNILTNVENDVRVKICTVMASDLKKAGLNVSFTPINFNKLTNLLQDKPYAWEAVVLGYGTGLDPHGNIGLWRSSGPTHQWWPNQKTPATAWEAQIDELLRQGAQTIDEAERKKIYDRFQTIAAEQLPLIYLINRTYFTAVRNRFGNLKPTSFGGAFWNMHEIYDLKATRDQP